MKQKTRAKLCTQSSLLLYSTQELLKAESCLQLISLESKLAEAWSSFEQLKRGKYSSQGSSQLLRKLIKALQLLLFHLVKLDVVLVSILLKAQGALWAGLNSSAEALIKVLRPLSKNHLLKARRAWSSDSVLHFHKFFIFISWTKWYLENSLWLRLQKCSIRGV